MEQIDVKRLDADQLAFKEALMAKQDAEKTFEAAKLRLAEYFNGNGKRSRKAKGNGKEE